MSDCLFCRMVAGEIPVEPVYQDEELMVIQDINPQAPLHVLVVPKRHISTLADLRPDDDGIVGEIVRRAAAIADEQGITARGFRTVFNTNKDAGQTVFHIHLHLLGGRNLNWPPG